MKIKSAFMRRGEVMELLTGEGLLPYHVRTLLENKTIIPVHLPGRKSTAIYSRAQIERDVLRAIEAQISPK